MPKIWNLNFLRKNICQNFYAKKFMPKLETISFGSNLTSSAIAIGCEWNFVAISFTDRAFLICTGSEIVISVFKISS